VKGKFNPFKLHWLKALEGQNGKLVMGKAEEEEERRTSLVPSGSMAFQSVSQIPWEARGLTFWQLSIYVVFYLPRGTITSHSMAGAYNKGCAIKIAKIVMQRATSKAITHATGVLAV
jgi:hypothetical protein